MRERVFDGLKAARRAHQESSRLASRARRMPAGDRRARRKRTTASSRALRDMRSRDRYRHRHRHAKREAEVTRNTLETQISVKLDLDGTGRVDASRRRCRFSTTCSTRSRATAFSTSRSKRSGDLHIDAHHTVEDIGITLGQAFAKAVGDKKGVRRYGHAYVPLDEALSRVVVDLSGRPGLEFNIDFVRARIGEFDVDLVHEFFQGFVNHAQVTLHVDNLRGDNAHHQAETAFKAFGRALRMAVELDPRIAGCAVDQRQPVGSGIAAPRTRTAHDMQTSPSSITGWATCARWRRRSSTSRRSSTVVVTERSGRGRARRARRFPGPGRDAATACARWTRAACARAVLDAAREQAFSRHLHRLADAVRAQRGGRHAGPRRCLPGKVRRFPADEMVDAHGQQAQGAAHGLERGAPERRAPAVGRHPRRQRASISCTAISPSPRSPSSIAGYSALPVPVHVRGGARQRFRGAVSPGEKPRRAGLRLLANFARGSPARRRRRERRAPVTAA